MILLSALLAFAAAGAPQTGWLDVAVDVPPVSSAQSEAMPEEQARLRAVPVGGRAADGLEAVDMPVAVPGRVRLVLRRDVAWRVELVSDRWWAAPATAYVTGDEQATLLRALPSAQIVGDVVVPKGETSPSMVQVFFAPPRHVETSSNGMVRVAGDAGVQGDSECAVVDGHFMCRLPAGVHDLKVHCRGFVSELFWAKELKAAKATNLGRLALRPGSSLLGWVATSEGPADPRTCRVSLRAVKAGVPSTREALTREEGAVAQAGIDRRGLFRMEGIRPGLYALEVTQPGFAPAFSGGFVIVDRGETELREAVILERPVRLRVHVVPHRDPYDKPWRLAVLRGERYAPTHELAFEAESDDAGSVVSEPMAPGPLRVDLYDSSGSRVAQRFAALSPGCPDVDIEVQQIDVSGRVSLGREPLAATMFFGRRTGSTRIKMQSGGRGQFSGVLPRDGVWEVQVTSSSPEVDRVLPSVEVEPDPQTHRAEVDLRLPDTALRGVVVDEEGTPVEAASVGVVDLTWLAVAFLRSGEDGRFEARGLEAGPYTVTAEEVVPAGKRQSDAVPVVLSEGGGGPLVRLVLREKRTLRGIVLGEGRPVPGARVTAVACNGLTAAWGEDASTDTSGRFELAIDQGCATLVLEVMPPGFSFRSFAVRLTDPADVTLGVVSQGGTAHLRLPEAIDWRDLTTAKWMLWQDGVPVGAESLLAWASLLGLPQSRAATEVTVPSLSPGFYRACLFRNFEGLTAAVAGGASGQGNCVEGYLPVNGELLLDLSAAK